MCLGVEVSVDGDGCGFGGDCCANALNLGLGFEDDLVRKTYHESCDRWSLKASVALGKIARWTRSGLGPLM